MNQLAKGDGKVAGRRKKFDGKDEATEKAYEEAEALLSRMEQENTGFTQLSEDLTCALNETKIGGVHVRVKKRRKK